MWWLKAKVYLISASYKAKSFELKGYSKDNFKDDFKFYFRV